MKYLILLALSLASQVASSVLPLGLTPSYYHPIQSLYHSQDKLGQYVYGYATPDISKSETKTTDGVTRGGYSYIDTNGHLQTVHYTADALNGFRVAASNLPQELPDVAHARAQHLAEFAQIAAVRAVPYSNPVAVPVSAVPQIPTHQQLPQPVQDLPEVQAARAAHLAALDAAYAGHVTAALPRPVQDLPEVVRARAEHLAAVQAIAARDAALQAEIRLSPIPDHLNGNVVPVSTAQEYAHAPLPVAQVARVEYTPAVVHGPLSSQHHAQDSWGQYTYGYVDPNSSKQETRTADGVVRGGYSYIDGHGVIQTVHYVADAAGFRVAATNIPVDRNHLATAVAHDGHAGP